MPSDKQIPASAKDEAYLNRKKQLHGKVETGGLNFSPIQTKLIQIGRALLCKPKLLLIESSFFNVEEIYERLFYALLFKNLEATAIVCIPERDHALGYLKVLVSMDAGKVAKIIRK